MTDDQIIAMMIKYEKLLTERGVPVVEHPHGIVCNICLTALAHLHTMFPEVLEFVAKGRREKAMRWLGFIQGVLWVCGLATIDELKNDNRTKTKARGRASMETGLRVATPDQLILAVITALVDEDGGVDIKDACDAIEKANETEVFVSDSPYSKEFTDAVDLLTKEQLIRIEGERYFITPLGKALGGHKLPDDYFD